MDRRRKRAGGRSRRGVILVELSERVDDQAVDGEPDRLAPVGVSAEQAGLGLIFEIDPLLCPACASAMKIVSVITEHNVIDAILSRGARRRRPQGALPIDVTDTA